VLEGRADVPARDARPGPEDVALVLSTSGTTSEPKRVPLSNRNLLASVERLSSWLALSAADRCLTVMPLFHIHGLVCCVLTPLLSGGRAYIVEGLSPQAIWQELQESKATWMTAVPTIHSALYNYARNEGLSPNLPHLRFLRSSSAAMSPSLLEGLEAFFDVPVVEAYGMTEASHQMSSNPLPPGARTRGSVGLAASTDIAVLDADWNRLKPNDVGEVAIQGPSVTRGYENNAQANADCFREGWFRTGDEGFIDEAGYLTLTGRIKEMINRGGEKISPLEVDRVLSSNPLVMEAISFAIPHASLGEDVAAAIVLNKGADADAAAIIRHAAQQLADFKVPKIIKFLQQIPKGATGKPQRIGLADRLGLSGAVSELQEKKSEARLDSARATAVRSLWARGLDCPHDVVDPGTGFVQQGGDSLTAARPIVDIHSRMGDAVAPANDVEAALKEIWEELLGKEWISVEDDFFLIGGDSVTAMTMFLKLEQRLERELPYESLWLQGSTIRALAKTISGEAPAADWGRAVPLQTNGDKPALFFVSNHAVPVFCLSLIPHFGADQPVYGLPAKGAGGDALPDRRIEDMAMRCIEMIRQVQPDGPYRIMGHSTAGLIAYEIAQILRNQGMEVSNLVILDSGMPGSAGKLAGKVLRKPFKAVRVAGSLIGQAFGFSAPKGLVTRNAWQTGALFRYRPRPYPGEAILILSAERRDTAELVRRWRRLVTGGLSVAEVPGDHLTMLQEPQIGELARTLMRLLDD